MEQKVIQIGNSIGVVVPQTISDDIGIRRGTRVTVVKQGHGFFVSPNKQKRRQAGGVNESFAKIVEEFMTDHEDVLKALAKR